MVITVIGGPLTSPTRLANKAGAYHTVDLACGGTVWSEGGQLCKTYLAHTLVCLSLLILILRFVNSDYIINLIPILTNRK